MRLVANFGAEEGMKDAARRPLLREPIQCWSWLFGAEAKVLGWQAPVPWPQILGPPTPDPAFPWIQGEGSAWIATEEAAAELRAEGIPPAFPDPSIVWAVNDKAFALRVAKERGLLPQSILPHLVALDPDGLQEERIQALIESIPPWVSGGWTLKPRLGSSGRGRVRRVEDIPGARTRLVGRQGAIFEPWLERLEDLSALVYVGPDGSLEWIGSTRQIISGAGIYLGNRGIFDDEARPLAGTPWDGELRRAAEILGEEAARAGYHGPIGMDAFVFLGPEGQPTLRAVVEINARFTMGFVAAGILRRAVSAGSLPLDGAWLFSLREREGKNVHRLGEHARLLWARDLDSL